MLVLARHRDESIIIPLPDGRRVRIMVVNIRGDQVRIGIEAPKDIPVHREEVMAAIDREDAAGRRDIP